MSASRRPTPGDRVVARLLRMAWRRYPGAMRRRYGAEAQLLFWQQCAEHRGRGRLAIIAYWIRSLRDAVESGRSLGRSPLPLLAIASRADGGASFMLGIVDDLRAAYRSLVAAPLFTFTTVAILALGVGGSAGVFSLLKGVILNPLPYEDPADLAILWTWEEDRDLPDGTSYLNWEDWRTRSRSFTDMAMYYRPEFTFFTLSGGDNPRRVHAGVVTRNFFDVLGTQPRLGRNFTAQEERDGAALALVSHAFWRQQLGGDGGALGEEVVLDGDSYEVIGVMPPGFRLPREDTAVWILHSNLTGWPEREFSRRGDAFVVVGRLTAGSSFADGQKDLDGVADQLSAEYPDTNANLGVRALPLLEQVTGTTLPRALWMLFGAMTFVLLIAAANAAHLGLARGATRTREMAVRAAIGAGGARLARQQVIEAALIAAVAGVLGAGLSVAVLRTLLAFAPADIPRLDEVGVDTVVLVGAWLATVTLGLMYSIVPASSAARRDAAEVLRADARGSETRARGRLRGALVVAEVAIAMVLVSGAGLLLQSLANASGEPPGVSTEGTVMASLAIPRGSYDSDQLAVFWSELEGRLRAESDIRDAGAIGDLFTIRIPDTTITVEGRAPDETPRVPATNEAVLPGFFAAAGATLLAGRTHTLADLQSEEPTRRIVINETAARTFWPEENAVGKRFLWGTDGNPEGGWNTVIGVVADIRRSALDVAPVAEFYLAGFFYDGDLVVTGAVGATDATIAALRRAVSAVDATIPVSNVRSVEDAYGESLSRRRFQSLLAASLAVIAVLLSAAGLFGLLFEAVARRRREIGVRLALGAEPRRLLFNVMSRATGLTVVGVAIGVAAALAFSNLLQSFLYEVGSTDLVTLAGAGLLLLVVGVLASLLPGLRATRVDPMESLSSE